MDFVALQNEVKYKTSRSGGSGGQNVNKVSTKVELLFDVEMSQLLSENQKVKLLDKLKNRIDNQGVFHLQCDETRSQLKNKELALERFLQLVSKALQPVKKRRKTKPSKASKEKRLSNKKHHSDKKRSRNFKIGD